MLSENEIGELFLQLYAYAGFPRSLNAQAVLANIIQSLEKKGTEYKKGDLPSRVPEDVPAGAKYDNGREVINEIFKRDASQKKPSTNGYSETTDVFLKEHLFNDIISRDNMNFAERELCTISILAAIGNVNPQLAAHFGGALNTGTAPEILSGEWLSVIEKSCGKKIAKNAKSVLNSVLKNR